MANKKYLIPISNTVGGIITFLSMNFVIAATLSSEINLSLFANDWIPYHIAFFLSVVIIFGTFSQLVSIFQDKQAKGYIISNTGSKDDTGSDGNDDDDDDTDGGITVVSEIIAMFIAFLIITLPVTSTVIVWFQ